MKKYSLQLFIFMLSVVFGGVSGMESEQTLFEQKLSMIERGMTECALSKLLFTDDEKILHVGFHCEDIIKAKTKGAQVYCIDTDTLRMLQDTKQKYDKVLSFDCWNVRAPKELFVNSACLLKPKGKFCAVFPYYKSPYLNVHYQVLANDKWKDQFNKKTIANIYGSKKMKKFLEEAKLENVECAIIKKPFKFKTKEKLMACIAALSPKQLDGIALERRAEFIKDVVNSYLGQYPAKKDNSILLHLSYMIISGYKL